MYDDDDGYDIDGDDLDDAFAEAPEEAAAKKEAADPEIKESEFAIPSQSSPPATAALINNLKIIRRMDQRAEGFECSLVHNNLYKWHIKMFGYDATDAIQRDLERTRDKHILVELTFPANFPFAPPFARVVRPQFVFRTGHVTLGGAICHQLLTRQGWSPANTIDFLVIQIRSAFVTGDGRIDLGKHGDYSEQEARQAFERLKATHGW
eukprot:gnl/Trimastix_PCT/1787.p1 GENE.gnl/Trimastix_PCT/1787~~gnl/Trimastix_PCT/1787.p1  ORF type:complete len:239 (+),score=77.23 gnl/Trimastix_PCT/1787:96-719(+)